MASQELGLFAYREGEKVWGRARGKGRVNEASSVLQVCGSVCVCVALCVWIGVTILSSH